MTAPPDLKEHTCEVPLRPNDFDWAGHLNNSVFPELLETGRWQWGLANGADMRHSPLVAAVVQLRLDYLKAVDWDPLGRLTVRTALAGSSAYSFTLAQSIADQAGDTVARAQVKLAVIDRETKRVHRADLRSLGLQGDPR